MRVSTQVLIERLTEIIMRVEGIRDTPVDYSVCRKLERASVLLHALLRDCLEDIPLSDRLRYAETVGKDVSADE